MKSKLTLRLDDDLKERAKRLAKERGTSVSQIVEDYFRLLLHEPPGGGHSDASQMEPAGDDLNTVPDDLPPRTRRMLHETDRATESLNLDEDTRSWIEAAHEKHE